MIDKSYLHFDPLEIHHLYLGLIAVAIGLVFGIQVFIYAGIVTACDDIGQHICQGSKMYGKGYFSPIAGMAAKTGVYDTKFYTSLHERWPRVFK